MACPEWAPSPPVSSCTRSIAASPRSLTIGPSGFRSRSPASSCRARDHCRRYTPVSPEPGHQWPRRFWRRERFRRGRRARHTSQALAFDSFNLRSDDVIRRTVRRSRVPSTRPACRQAARRSRCGSSRLSATRRANAFRLAELTRCHRRGFPQSVRRRAARVHNRPSRSASARGDVRARPCAHQVRRSRSRRRRAPVRVAESASRSVPRP